MSEVSTAGSTSMSEMVRAAEQFIEQPFMTAYADYVGKTDKSDPFFPFYGKPLFGNTDKRFYFRKFKNHKEYLEGLEEEINAKEPMRNKWTILPLYVNNGIKTQIPVRGQEFVLFPNSIPDEGKSNINPVYIKNYNDFKEKIKEVIKKQAGKFLIS